MQTLLVYPNPWSAFDKNGVPCGVCPRDPDADAGGPGQYVGARVDKKNTKVLQDFAALHGGGARGAALAKHELRSPIQATFYEYMGVPSQDPELAELLAKKDPIEIPATKYYRDRLQEGSLIAANAETAKAARLRGFTPPKDFFAFKRLKALDGALPQSPDVAGNVLEAPATPDSQPREGVTMPADGEPRTAELAGGPVTASAEVLPAAEAQPGKSTKPKKPSQESSQ